MAQHSNIEWTDATWNPIVGCSIVSPGCTNCYAMAMAARINKMTLASHYEGLTHKVNGHQVWTGKIASAPKYLLTAPMRWKKPKRIFVNSMGDLFHESIPDEWIDRVFAVMALAPQHTFQVLTKRAERMREYVAQMTRQEWWKVRIYDHATNLAGWPGGSRPSVYPNWPLENVWLGVSAERQQEADERIPPLLDTPAAVRFVSCEPLLGRIDLTNLQQLRFDALYGVNERKQKINWVIVGGESGPKARPMHPQWARDLRDQCRAAGVPYFFKQWGGWKQIECAADGSFDYSDELRVLAVNGQHCAFADIERCDFPDTSAVMEGVGKKAAGRLLDGVEHNSFPSVAA